MISAVVPTFRRREALLAALPNHLRLAGVAELIVVDDGSDDGTAQAVEALGLDRVRVVRHAHNRGLPAARNTGAATATQEWVVFLEDDCGFPADYALQLLEVARGHNADIVGAPWLHTPQNAQARVAPSRPVQGVALLDPPWVHPGEPIVTPYLPALALVRRAVFEQVQYDETYRGNFFREETDFFVSAYRRGFTPMLTPTTSSWQLGAFDGGCKLSSQLRYDAWSVRNTTRLLCKHGRWLRRNGLLPRPPVLVLLQFTGPLLPFYLKAPARLVRRGWHRLDGTADRGATSTP